MNFLELRAHMTLYRRKFDWLPAKERSNAR